AQGGREAEVFQVSNNDTAVAQRRLEDKQPEEKTNTDCLVKEQEKEYQTGWKIKTGNVIDFFNQRSPSSAIGFKTPIDMLRFFCWLASIKQWMLGPVKVNCIFLGYHKSIVGNKLKRLDDVTSKVVLYRNMCFNESGKYTKTFIGSGVGTGLMQVLHGFKFEVKPLGDHTLDVEPQENIDQGAGLQEVQTQYLMDYQLARDREQHLACELFRYREDSNGATFTVAAVEKIYAHESLTFNNTVASTVAGNAVMTSMAITGGIHKGLLAKAKGNILSMEIVRDHSGNTLRVSQSRFYNGKLSIRDCDVEKNGKWSCIYAVGSQEYQMVCTRLDIASADV
nr:hypothetical protein [Tanacetum cinerariifolium]